MSSLVRSCIAAALTVRAYGQDGKEGRGMGCTAIAIDGGASFDGSAYAGMNADCADCDIRLTFIPAKHHTEPMRNVYSFPLSYPHSIAGSYLNPEALGKPNGQIPQVNYTFGYYASTQPLMNDQGLGMGESSCAAMLMNKVAGSTTDTRDVPTGFIDTAQLMQLALERCATARCAVDLMGELVETHGFLPTSSESSPMVSPTGQIAYGDSGEAYTLSDKTGEAWIFHVVGGVSHVLRSAWAAQRVPKGHAAFVPNAFIIGVLPDAPNDDYRFSPKLRQAATTAQLWDTKKPFDFSRIFGPAEMTFHPLTAAPQPLYGSVRRYVLHNMVAPSLGVKFTMDNMDFPFSVKVEKPMTHNDVFGLLKTNYEGTEFDLTQGVLAGPFRTPFRIEGGSNGMVPRGISVQRTLYSIVVQANSDRQIAWYASDTPATSVYVPLYATTGTVATQYFTGVNTEVNRNSAWWAFDFVNNWMQLNYQDMSTEDVFPAMQKWQDTIDRERAEAEKRGNKYLSEWQRTLQERVVQSWWKMADHLVMKFNDQKHSVPGGVMGGSKGYPQDWADMVGFSQDVHPVWVQPASKPPAGFEGYVAPTEVLPRSWNGKAWVYPDPPAVDALAGTPEWHIVRPGVYTGIVLLVGFFLGRSAGRRESSGSIEARLLG